MTLCTIEDGFNEKNWEKHGRLFLEIADVYESFLDVRDDHVRPAGVHASEITGCLRSAAYTMTGVEKKGVIGKMWRKKFDHGHAVHEWIQKTLHEMAARMGAEYDFEDEVRINPENNELAADWNIYSSCDGVISFRRDGEVIARLCLEIKTASAAQYEKLTAPEEYHVEQAHVYMACLDLPATWLLYFNKGNENTTPSGGPFLVRYDPAIWSRVVQRMVDVYELLEQGKLPPRKEGIWCEWCRYAWTCKPAWRRTPRDKSAERAMMNAPGVNILWKKPKGSR